MGPPRRALYQIQSPRKRPRRSWTIKRSGIIASAIVAFFGSVVSILLGVFMAFGGVAMRAAPQPTTQPRGSLAVVVIMALIYCGFGVWGIASGVGLLRRRNWARLCFVIFGGFLAFFSFCAAAGILLALVIPTTPPLPDNVSQSLFTAIFVVLAAVSLACLGIAIWWLVYFNRSAVKASFAGDTPLSPPSRFPVSVSIISWLLIVGSAISAVQMLFPYPVLLLGIVFRGWAAGLLLALFAAVGLSAGIGMLKKRIEAHSLAVGYFGFGIVNVAALVLLPGSFGRWQAVLREIQGNPTVLPVDMKAFMMLTAFAGVLAVGAMLFLLIRARKPFVDACQVQVE
jgi:hypothetical protein